MSAKRKAGISKLMAESSRNILVRIEPVLVGVEDAASILSISVTAFKDLGRTGQLGPMPIQVGTLKRRLWSVCELRRWAEAGCPTREIWQGMED